MRKIKYILALLCCIITALNGCVQKKQQPVSVTEKKPEHSYTIKGSVREMSITPEITNFPEGEGKSEFTSYCSMCHSLRYISMQPNFSKKIWEEEVHKMVAKYNAPIDSVTCIKIVDYLVKVKS